MFCVFLCVVWTGVSYNKENDGENVKCAKMMNLRVLSEEIWVGTEDGARNGKKWQKNYFSGFLALSRTATELLILSRSARTPVIPRDYLDLSRSATDLFNLSRSATPINAVLSCFLSRLFLHSRNWLRTIVNLLRTTNNHGFWPKSPPNHFQTLPNQSLDDSRDYGSIQQLRGSIRHRYAGLISSQ